MAPPTSHWWTHPSRHPINSSVSLLHTIQRTDALTYANNDTVELLNNVGEGGVQGIFFAIQN